MRVYANGYVIPQFKTGQLVPTTSMVTVGTNYSDLLINDVPDMIYVGIVNPTDTAGTLNAVLYSISNNLKSAIAFLGMLYSIIFVL